MSIAYCAVWAQPQTTPKPAATTPATPPKTEPSAAGKATQPTTTAPKTQITPAPTAAKPAAEATPTPTAQPLLPPMSLMEFPMPFEQADSIFGRQHIITFRPYSIEPTDEGLQAIGKVAQIFDTKPSVIKHNRLVIQTFSCPQEIAAKPYLGACRGQWIVDFLEKSVLLSRTKCNIIEGGAQKANTQCQGNSGVILYIKPAN